LIDQLLIVCLTIFVYELLVIIKFSKILRENFIIYKKIIKLIGFKKGSDLRKFKLILNYSKFLLTISFKMILILLIILILILLLNQISNTFLNFITSILGVFEITLLYVFYRQIRKRTHGKL